MYGDISQAVASGKIGVRVSIVPGATDQSAYRSEVAGLFGIATWFARSVRYMTSRQGLSTWVVTVSPLY
jgi:hypothetical protein